MLTEPFTRIYIPGKFANAFFTGIFVLLLLAQANPLRAQSGDTVEESLTATELARGYWRLKTNVADRSTSIRFYAPTQELLYEEIWPGKWIKLTDKNQRHFDKLLDKLLNRRLVASEIAPQPFPFIQAQPESANKVANSDRSRHETIAGTSHLVHAYVTKAGKVYVVVDNPDQLRCRVSVTNEMGLTLYEEFNHLDHYRRWLDLSNIAHNSFQLLVKIDEKSYVYNVRRKDSSTYDIESPTSGGTPQFPVQRRNDIDSPPISADL
ncbi:hypothetical protein [Persicitalea jodogahamensis]|uniref:Uncharacterized protein n=1 Tax=Persicitalea jodogahamensis TaxID=402147 RepID=A0A8J3D7J6_9BACT|nr:hypothetical protein [Persicitalea jodogahamensis]GHB61677.1 hypothetical protein GCM10007390_14480 [Persicitalea jodogahamensis]